MHNILGKHGDFQPVLLPWRLSFEGIDPYSQTGDLTHYSRTELQWLEHLRDYENMLSVNHITRTESKVEISFRVSLTRRYILCSQ